MVRSVSSDSLAAVSFANVSAIRHELEEIRRSTMLFAPRVTTIVEQIEKQLRELEQELEDMAETTTALLTGKSKNWDYTDNDVLVYQTQALTRFKPMSSAIGSGKKNGLQFIHTSPICKSMWLNKFLRVDITHVFPLLKLHRVNLLITDALTGRQIIQQVLKKVLKIFKREAKSQGKATDAALDTKDTEYGLRFPGTNECLGSDQLVLSSESIREALANQYEVEVCLEKATSNEEVPFRDDSVQYIHQMKLDLAKHKPSQWKNTRDTLSVPPNADVLAYDSVALACLDQPFRIKIRGIDGCSEESLPLLQKDKQIGLYVRALLTLNGELLGGTDPFLDTCTEVARMSRAPRFARQPLPRADGTHRMRLWSSIPFDARILFCIYGKLHTKKEAKEGVEPKPDPEKDTILGCTSIPFVDASRAARRGSYSLGVWPFTEAEEGAVGKIPVISRQVSHPNRAKSGVATLTVEFPTFLAALVADDRAWDARHNKRFGMSRQSFVGSIASASGLTLRSFRVRVIKGFDMVSRDSNGLSDPFVKVYAKNGTTRHKIGQTPRISKTLNPVWDTDEKSCTFEGTGDSVIFEVWDHDFIGSNDFMGVAKIKFGDQRFAALDTDTKGEEVKLVLSTRDEKDDPVTGSLTIYVSVIKSEFDDPELRRLTSVDLMHSLTRAEQKTLWDNRYKLTEHPQTLPMILRGVNWTQPAMEKEAFKLLNVFKAPQRALMAMQYLGPQFLRKRVRAYAVKLLSQLEDAEMALYMPQLVQCLKFEPHHDSALSRMLITRALQSPYQVGHKLFWTIKAEISFQPMHAERFQLVLEEYLLRAGQHRHELSKQYVVCKRFEEVSHRVTQARRTEKKEVVDEMYHSMLRNINEQLLSAIGKFQLPLDPKIELTTLIVEKCRYMSSKMVPLWLVFRNADPNAEPYKVIFKTGDDLRQDILTLQMLEVMNQIWMSKGKDMRLKIYKVLATGINRHGAGVGLIQVVDNSATTSGIQAKQGGGASGAFNNRVLMQYLQMHNRTTSELAAARENFTYSCAGYCVATYVLGIGDRHNGNIMCSEDGHLFHIDFGHFLGNFKSKFGIKRERTPFVFTPEMATVIEGEEGRKGDGYTKFLEICKFAYSAVRENANTLQMMFMLMTSAGMPELLEDDDIEYLRQQLNLQMTEAMADQHLTRLIEKSRADTYKRIDNYIHILKHGS